MISFFMEIKTCIQQVCVTLIKHDSKDIYNVTKDFKISSKCCYELCIHKRINKKYFLSRKLAY